jgi:HEAT repeat protein/TLC ATP/ADP transporter
MSTPTSSLARAIGVRPGEGGRLASVAALFALIETGRGFGEIGVETLVLGRFGPTGLPGVLPFLYMGLGAVGLVVALAYTAALGRLARAPLFIGVVGLGAALIVVWRVALEAGIDGVLLALWLTVYVIGSLVMTVYWTVAGATFDARQAKRLFPLLTGAAIAGAFFGSLAAGPVAGLIGAANLVLIEAAALGLAVPLLSRLVSRPRTDLRPSSELRSRRRRSVVADIRAGFDVVAASPLLRRIAIAYVLLSILMFSVQYPFTISAAATFPTDTERATALGLLSAAITAASFLVSILVTNRVYARFGVSVGALLLPIVYLAGFVVWLVQFSFPTAAAFRFSQQVTQRGLSNASWSAFYNVVPAGRRAQVLAFNDGIPGQLGTILSGVLLLAAGRVLAPDQLFWLGAITALIATVVVIGIRRRYGQSLVAALRSGAAERVLEGGPGVALLVRDPSVGPALVEAMAAPEPGVRELAASMLDKVDTPNARSALQAATRDPDAGVRLAAIRAIGRSPTGLAPDAVDLEMLATDPDPRVRAAVLVSRAQRDLDVGAPRVVTGRRIGAGPTGPDGSDPRPRRRVRSRPRSGSGGPRRRRRPGSGPAGHRRACLATGLDRGARCARGSGRTVRPGPGDPSRDPGFRAAPGRPHDGPAPGSARLDCQRGAGRGVPGRRPGSP